MSRSIGKAWPYGSQMGVALKVVEVVRIHTMLGERAPLLVSLLAASFSTIPECALTLSTDTLRLSRLIIWKIMSHI